jgi:16S rRNA (adenine1518-N6/adenine1519-N6)-dimethyltransferase
VGGGLRFLAQESLVVALASSDLPTTDKSLGQHWLSDTTVLEDIAAAACVTPEDTILEIGPGPGTLTQVLVQQAKQVVAVEFDRQLAAALPRRVTADNLTVVSQDILSFDLTTLPADYVVVANIPYYLTSKLIRVLSESSNQAKRAVILIQKEVAERVAAKPGDMSLLSVSAQFYWEVELDAVVPARLFTPPPKVDSQVIVMTRRGDPLFDVDTKAFFRLVKAGYSARRKTLQNSLSGGLRISREVAGELLSAAGLSPTARPQELSLEQWHNLFTVAESHM